MSGADFVVIPSIDVRAGRVVRLVQGDYARETVFAADPVAVVRGFVDAGASRVHIVDLDAARGRPDAASIDAVSAAVGALNREGVEVQVGGGIRDRASAQRWLCGGARFVVIGSLAIRDPAAARALCEAFPDRVLLALDVRADQASAEGWTEAGGSALDHLRRWTAWPAAGVVHTAIERDGMLAGPAVTELRTVCRHFDGTVIASGGVTTLDDVARCREAGAGGVIVGRALHEGSFDLRAALARFATGAAA